MTDQWNDLTMILIKKRVREENYFNIKKKKNLRKKIEISCAILLPRFQLVIIILMYIRVSDYFASYETSCKYYWNACMSVLIFFFRSIVRCFCCFVWFEFEYLLSFGMKLLYVISMVCTCHIWSIMHGDTTHMTTDRMRAWLQTHGCVSVAVRESALTPYTVYRKHILKIKSSFKKPVSIQIVSDFMSEAKKKKKKKNRHTQKLKMKLKPDIGWRWLKKRHTLLLLLQQQAQKDE